MLRLRIRCSWFRLRGSFSDAVLVRQFELLTSYWANNRVNAVGRSLQLVIYFFLQLFLDC